MKKIGDIYKLQANGNEVVIKAYSNGYVVYNRLHSQSPCVHIEENFDKLYTKKKKMEIRYFNIYKGAGHLTREAAEKIAENSPNYIKCIELEIEVD